MHSEIFFIPYTTNHFQIRCYDLTINIQMLIPSWKPHQLIPFSEETWFLCPMVPWDSSQNCACKRRNSSCLQSGSPLSIHSHSILPMTWISFLISSQAPTDHSLILPFSCAPCWPSPYSFHVFDLPGFVYHTLLTLPFLAYFYRHPPSLVISTYPPLLFSEKMKSFQLHREDRKVVFLLEASSFGPSTYIREKWGPFWSDQAIVLILFTVTECGS